MTDDILLWTFQYHYHKDVMKAAEECSPVTFSALTVRLCLAIEESLEKQALTWKDGEGIDGFLRVRGSIG